MRLSNYFSNEIMNKRTSACHVLFKYVNYSHIRIKFEKMLTNI